MPSIAALALTLAAIGTPAPDYTPIDAWVVAWEQAVAEQGGLTPELVAEWRAIQDTINPPEPEPVIVAPRITTPSPPAYPVPAGEMVERWRPLVEAHFAPADVPWAMRVMACESGGNPNAANPTSSARGLFQFIRSTWNWVAPPLGYGSHEQGAVFDPEANVRSAAWLYYNGGASHWECK